MAFTTYTIITITYYSCRWKEEEQKLYFKWVLLLLKAVILQLCWHAVLVLLSLVYGKTSLPRFTLLAPAGNSFLRNFSHTIVLTRFNNSTPSKTLVLQTPGIWVVFFCLAPTIFSLGFIHCLDCTDRIELVGLLLLHWLSHEVSLIIITARAWMWTLFGFSCSLECYNIETLSSSDKHKCSP